MLVDAGCAAAEVSPTTIRSRILKARTTSTGYRVMVVSPTTIRSRILKDDEEAAGLSAIEVSPTTIRSRILKVWVEVLDEAGMIGFTHNDPFEDTESCQSWYQ